MHARLTEIKQTVNAFIMPNINQFLKQLRPLLSINQSTFQLIVLLMGRKRIK